jgi:LmbE family N-acetylglucosaminyl deacetylase
MISMNPESSQIPLRRPHFHLRNRQLFFLISKRPYVELAAADADLWNAIDGSATTAVLRESFPHADKTLERFRELEIIEIAPAIWRTDRKRVLVIEPHMDDAALSVGGLMWRNRERCEFTVASVAGRSNFTSYHKINRDYFDVDKVTALRRSESELVMRVLGGKHLVLDGLDAPLRYQPGDWTLEWYLKNRRGISAFINHSAAGREVEACAASIERQLLETNAREIWIPMGIGTSADHETTRDASLHALMRLADAGREFEVFLYQDVPYAMNFPLHAGQILSSLASGGASLERLASEITDVMPEKLRLISIFASQFKMSYMRPKVEATARLTGGSGGRMCELLVRVERLPRRIDGFELYSGRSDVLGIRGRLSGWRRRHRMARRMAILCPMGVGRWKENMEVLLRCFPDTTFDVHMTADACDETNRFVSPRIRIRPVRGLARAWIFRLLRVLLWPSCPLIIFTGTRHRNMIPLMRAMFAISNPIPATTMDHLVQALVLDEA